MKNFDDCSRAVRIERWQNVVRVLENLTPHQRRKHWNMENWTLATDCGTVACAAGHCGMDTWFRKRGFKMGPKDLTDQCSRHCWSSADDFFGYGGSRDIFKNSKKRPVSKVIKEVKDYIERLKHSVTVAEDLD